MLIFQIQADVYLPDILRTDVFGTKMKSHSTWLTLGVFGPAKDRAMSSLPGDTEGSTSPGELLHRIRQQRGTLDLRIC